MNPHINDNRHAGEAHPILVVIDIVTADVDYASSTPRATIAFNLSQGWTTEQDLGPRVPGRIVSEGYILPQWPENIRLSAAGGDNWCFERIILKSGSYSQILPESTSPHDFSETVSTRFCVGLNGSMSQSLVYDVMHEDEAEYKFERTGFVAAENGKMCPTGTKVIPNKHVCLQATSWLGGLDSTMWGPSSNPGPDPWATHPHGCFYHIDNNAVYWNPEDGTENLGDTRYCELDSYTLREGECRKYDGTYDLIKCVYTSSPSKCLEACTMEPECRAVDTEKHFDGQCWLFRSDHTGNANPEYRCYQKWVQPSMVAR